MRQNMKAHVGTSTCRAQQVQNQLRVQGLHPLPNLIYGKLLKWADVAYERVPARARNRYRRKDAWNARGRRRLLTSTPDYTTGLYKDLGDVLFVEDWVVMLLKHRDISITATKEHLKPVITMLQRIQARDDEFKKALVVTHALGGDRAINVMLVSEGLWTLER